MTDKQNVLDRRRHPFAMVTKTVLKDTTIKASDKAVYSILCMYADNNTSDCYPSRETIIKEAGVSDNTLRKSIRKLKEKGYIGVERRASRYGRASNLYTLLDAEKSR